MLKGLYILLVFYFLGASLSDYYETVAKIECTTNGVSVTETISADADKASEKKNDDNQQEKTVNGDSSNGEKNDEKNLASTSAATGATEATVNPAWIKQSNRTREEMEEAALVRFSSVLDYSENVETY